MAFGKERERTHTVVMQELFDKVYMGEDHAPAAVSFKLQFVKSVTEEEKKPGETENRQAGLTNPSNMSFARRSRYAFHLSPMTFPHEKQRTGMI
jgi:hypothetical protein